MKNKPAEPAAEPAPDTKPMCSHPGCNKPAAWSFDGKLFCTEHHNDAAEAFRRSQAKVPSAGK